MKCAKCGAPVKSTLKKCACMTNDVKTKILILSNRKISCLPDEVDKMESLEELDLSYTDIKSLPEFLKKLKKLKKIDLSYTSIVSIPQWFQELKSLEYLNLNDNLIQNLEFLPPNLKTLILPTIRFFPPAILGLKKLQRLDLGSSIMDEIPLSIYDLNLKNISEIEDEFPEKNSEYMYRNPI